MVSETIMTPGRYAAIGIILTSLYGCESARVMPTAPSPIAAPNLRWDLVAPGCQPNELPSPIPDSRLVHLEPAPHGRITGVWSYGTGLLTATFVPDGTDLTICEWDRSDL
jgi:hypothetical protein